MTTSQTITPVSPDRVLAAALRLTLVPTTARRRAVRELRDVSQGQSEPLRKALTRLRADEASGQSSRAAAMTESLLRATLISNDRRAAGSRAHAA